MNLNLLKFIVELIEGVFKHTAPAVAAAAKDAAVASVESDPKVQAVTEASIALLAATQSLKSAIAAHPDSKPA